MVGITIPTFVIAPLLILIFGRDLAGFCPAGGIGRRLDNFILPVIALALPQIAISRG